MMSLYQSHAFEIPEETVQVAKAAFPKGNVYMTMRDELGPLFADEDFAALFAWQGQTGELPGLLAMVTVMQFMEGLADRQAAEAVRSRIDWKYALGLRLTDAGFHYSILSPFRDRLLAGGAEAQLFDRVLALQATRPSQTRAATHELNPRPGGCAQSEPAGTGRRNDPPSMINLAAPGAGLAVGSSDDGLV